MNFPLGLLLGALVALLLAAYADPDAWPNLEKYDAFIVSAVVSLLIASVAAAGIQSNIANQIRLTTEQRQRKLLAARSVLPTVAGTLSVISENGLLAAIRLAKGKELSVEELQKTIESVSIPSDALSVMRDLIEFSEDESVAKYVAYTIEEHQVYVSRLNSLAGGSNFEKAERVVEWAYMTALFDWFYLYSRHKMEVPRFIDGSTVSAKLGWPDMQMIRELEYPELTHNIELLLDVFSDIFAKKFLERIDPATAAMIKSNYGAPSA